MKPPRSPQVLEAVRCRVWMTFCEANWVYPGMAAAQREHLNLDRDLFGVFVAFDLKGDIPRRRREWRVGAIEIDRRMVSFVLTESEAQVLVL